MKRAEMLDVTESILEKASFQVSERCVARTSCFDFAARREEQLAFVKVSSDIGNVSAKDASELQTISGCFSAMPLFIGDRTRMKPLGDDTVYMRYNIYTITPKTLEDIVFCEMNPLVEAGPGGYYVSINGNVIREKRQKLGLSVGKLAEMIGISRRTLYGYEKGMAKASVSVAYNLEWVLGVPVVQPFNMFQKSISSIRFLSTTRQKIIRNRFLQRVLRGFARFNISVAPTRRAPFDFIAHFSQKRFNVIGGVVDERDQDVDQRTEEIISISRVVEAHSVFITDGEQIPNNNIPLIHHGELAKMSCLEDLFARLDLAFRYP